MNRSRLIRISIVIAVIIAGAMLYLALTNNEKTDTSSSETTNTSAPVTYSGTIRAIDIEGMATDGAGLYELETKDGTIVVSLSPGESSCDTTAIQIPDLKIGDQAEARGVPKQGASPQTNTIIDSQNGVLQICEAGTYLKKV